MAKLAVLAHACGSTFDIRGPRENRPWDQVETTEPGAYPLTIVDLDGMRYEEYDPDGERRQERLDAYARYSADQETYWTRRREEDQLRFRSAWLASVTDNRKLHIFDNRKRHSEHPAGVGAYHHVGKQAAWGLECTGWRRGCC